MTLKAFLFALALSVFSFSTQAATFENMEGSYTILSCKNEGANPSYEDGKLCEYTQMTIHPQSYATLLYFSKWEQQHQYVRAFGLPKNMTHLPNGKYIERGDTYASFTNDSRGYGEVFVMRKVKEGFYHFSMHRRLDAKKTFDVFEIELHKISPRSSPMPPPAYDDEEGGNVCEEP